MSMQERLEDLRRRKDQAALGGGHKRVEAQHGRGKLTARERIALLADPGTFEEFDSLVLHSASDFGVDQQRYPGDAVVTGYAKVEGRPVCLFSQDFTVIGGSVSEAAAEKICKVMDIALKTGVPVIGINDGGGARIQEGVASLKGYGEVFRRNVRASGVIPQLSVIMGPTAGGAVYSPSITDFVFMVEDHSYMFITGPDVVRAVTMEEVTDEELGGARVHATQSGVAHFVSENEEACLAEVRRLVSFLPLNNLEDPPVVEMGDDPRRRDEEMLSVLPENESHPYDVREVIYRVVDSADFLEVHADYAQNIVAGFARLAGHRRVAEGGALRALLRLLQHPHRQLRGRDRLHAGHGAGARRHHLPRRQARLRLRGGDGAEGELHPAQGLRRRLHRHGVEAPWRRRQPRLAVGVHRRHRAGGGREHRLPLPVGPGAGEPRQAHRRLPGALCQPLRLRRPRLDRRRHRPAGHALEAHPLAGAAAEQGGAAAQQEARQHPSVEAESQTCRASGPIPGSRTVNLLTTEAF